MRFCILNLKSRIFIFTSFCLEDWTFIAHESQSNSILGRGVYVNLLQNPERYTGYAGPSAQRVWHAIQQENCFGGLSDTCLEKRIFFRLVILLLPIFQSSLMLTDAQAYERFAVFNIDSHR